jgi:hypothetical protein
MGISPMPTSKGVASLLNHKSAHPVYSGEYDGVTAFKVLILSKVTVEFPLLIYLSDGSIRLTRCDKQPSTTRCSTRRKRRQSDYVAFNNKKGGAAAPPLVEYKLLIFAIINY